jgi:hypothetical protein
VVLFEFVLEINYLPVFSSTVTPVETLVAPENPELVDD